ncbi:gluconokinase [Pseudoduganella lutea]|uniref:Gluconokinase n=2 Tax=Pseudoduganella lutea TaxID=321985 RepID=A0A4P6L6G5_9BURK|nr:gluconokinase [Pseudoduganella lutea]
MGVAGCGKSSVGAALAERLGVRYVEGDRYHSPENVAKMSAGVPLTDGDRLHWLASLQGEIRDAMARGEGIVVACSALKRRYRDLLREGVPGLRFAHLAGTRELIEARMSARVGHYMPLSLLDSQFAALEPLQPDEAGIVLDIAEGVTQLVDRITHAA